MRKDSVTNFLLLVIALALIAIAVRPYLAPHAVEAQSSTPYPLYFEPGTQMLRGSGWQPPGVWTGSGRYEDGENMGFSDYDPRYLPGECSGYEAASLASFCAGKVRL